MTSASSLSTVQFMYWYRTISVMPSISFKIYFLHNFEVLQENAAVPSILHSLKTLIACGRHFHTTGQKHNNYVDLVLKAT